MPAMTKRIFASLILTALLAATTPALAQHDDHWHGGHGYGDDHWHGDINHFRDYDFDRWRGGSWFHGPHDGRDGWWWTVGGQWYYYPAPVYPYPDPYLPPGVAVAAAPGGATYLYYCRNPQGYYPYVPACYGHWHPVVAEAPPAVMAPPPPAVQPVPVAPPPVAPAPAGMATREQDGRQLNAFAAELSQIDIQAPHARAKLKDLAARVNAYHHALFQRSYNAMDILRDTEDLQQRIKAEQAALPKKKPPVAMPAPVPAPAVVAPPGSP